MSPTRYHLRNKIGIASSQQTKSIRNKLSRTHDQIARTPDYRPLRSIHELQPRVSAAFRYYSARFQSGCARRGKARGAWARPFATPEVSAVISAVCTASSTKSTCRTPTLRVRMATSRPYSRRKKCSTSPEAANESCAPVEGPDKPEEMEVAVRTTPCPGFLRRRRAFASSASLSQRFLSPRNHPRL
jgi:hypothetical protein